MNAPPGPLFRPEVAAARHERLHGEIVLAQPVSTHVLVWLLFAIIAAIATWLATGQYARTETAAGILVTSRPTSKVMATRAGQVAELLVKEGDLVKAGQRLLSIQVEQPTESGASAISDSLRSVEAQRQLTLQQLRLSELKAQGERGRLIAALSGFDRQKADLNDQIALQRELVASSLRTYEQLRIVAEKGFVSQMEAERRRQEYLTARQQLSRLEQQLGSIAAERAQTEAEVGRLAAVTGSEATGVQSTAESLEQQRSALEAEQAYVVKAPITGRVTALQTAIGRFVNGNVPLLIIVPEGSALVAELYVPTRAAGFLRSGQEVRLLYDAFPYQRFGSFWGRVENVSRVVLDPRELDVPLKIEEPVYKASVEVSKQQISAYGQSLPLQPGMTLRGNIILDRRSFLDWLLEPLNAVIRKNN